jgi:hypothetical protein
MRSLPLLCGFFRPSFCRLRLAEKKNDGGAGAGLAAPVTMPQLTRLEVLQLMQGEGGRGQGEGEGLGFMGQRIMLLKADACFAV